MKNIFDNNHIFYFFKEVNDETVNELISSINSCIMEDEKTIRANNDKMLSIGVDITHIKHELPHIIIHLNTGGGSVYSALALYDFLENIKKKYVVEIIGQGHVMSAGTLIMQGASIRKSYKNTYYMIHGVSSWEFGTIAKLEESLEHTKQLQETYLGIMDEKTHLTKDDLKNRFQKSENWYFNAQDALGIGLIDEIIE